MRCPLSGGDDGGDDSSSASSDPVEDVKEDVVISEDGTHYTVYTTAGFTQWAEAVATNPSIDCTLEGDITLTGTPWTSIGGTYTGTFDGQGHSISGLNGGCGLFAYIGETGAVKNVKLVSVSFTTDDEAGWSGGVAGTNSASITDCYWRKGPEQAVGDDGDPTTATELTTDNLNDAIIAMNKTLGENFGYHYVAEGDDPVLQPMTAANLLAQYFGLTLPL